MPKLRNILIFVGIFVLILAGYYLFVRQSPDQGANLVSSAPATTIPTPTNSVPASLEQSLAASDFLTLLLNVRNIKLEDAIFNDPAFARLQDSTIVITQDGTEGRPNPFADFGVDQVPLPPANQTANPTNNTPGTVTGGANTPASGGKTDTAGSKTTSPSGSSPKTTPNPNAPAGQ